MIKPDGLLITKNQKAFLYYKNLFQTRNIKKQYLALVYGQLKNPSGIIDLPLGRIGMKRTTRMTGNKLKDRKEAETEYKTIKKFDDYSLLEVSPKTGRTHQIRVHLKSTGHPIVGDPIYGFTKRELPRGLNRLFLHAFRLEFSTPDDKRLVLEADLPEDLQNFISGLK